MKNATYINRKNHSTYEDKQMPNMLKFLSEAYSSLDMADLRFLKYKAIREHDKERHSAIHFAYGRKSDDSEIAVQQLEGRYYGNAIELKDYQVDDLLIFNDD